MRQFIDKHYADICIAGGAIMVNIALIYGLNARFGLWGFLFWGGLGVLYVGIKIDAKDER